LVETRQELRNKTRK